MEIVPAYFYHRVQVEFVFEDPASMDEDMMEAFVPLELLYNKPERDQLHTENDERQYTLKENEQCSRIYS